ncbi:hypothetical protein HF086_011147 [Spodoptera exigua]|uniref:Uncharacterized protein n=1 Tax=Spodoptera exigua TaxID=7107 RepID=A0A922S831_SPOEX|nr:hypothetical protein HF086_011147 [Spodoptera exigua]
MQTTRLRPLFQLASLNKEVISQTIKRGTLGNIQDPETIMRLFDKYGPMIRLDSILGKPPLLFLSDPDSAELVSYRLPFQNTFVSAKKI